MSLPAPILPQVEDGYVQQTEINDGLTIQIPYSGDQSESTIFVILLNNTVITLLNGSDPSGFPLEYTIKKNFTINEKYSVTYLTNTVQSPSPPADFTVVNSTISIKATSGAAADGVSTNQVVVSIENGNPNSGKSVLLTIVGSSAFKRTQLPIFSNGKNAILVTTDNSGTATENFSSMAPGNFIIVATFQQKMVGTISSFASYYPVLMDTKEVLCESFVSINAFLFNNYLTEGHNYKLVFSSQPTSTGVCSSLRVYDYKLKGCVLTYPNSFQFNDEGLESFTVLKSDFANELYSNRYAYFKDSKNVTVQLWDYGKSDL